MRPHPKGKFIGLGVVTETPYGSDFEPGLATEVSINPYSKWKQGHPLSEKGTILTTMSPSTESIGGRFKLKKQGYAKSKNKR